MDTQDIDFIDSVGQEWTKRERYTALREENARLKEQLATLWNSDACEDVRKAREKLARCVEAGNHLRGFAAGTDLGKAYIADWDAALTAAKGE